MPLTKNDLEDPSTWVLTCLSDHKEHNYYDYCEVGQYFHLPKVPFKFQLVLSDL
jgi:hypothetical protein